jgi:hypothetical protein
VSEEKPRSGRKQTHQRGTSEKYGRRLPAQCGAHPVEPLRCRVRSFGDPLLGCGGHAVNAVGHGMPRRVGEKVLQILAEEGDILVDAGEQVAAAMMVYGGGGIHGLFGRFGRDCKLRRTP